MEKVKSEDVMKKKVLVECEKCHCKNDIKSIKLKEAKMVELGGKLMNVLYFNCPSCNSVFIVAINDSDALTMQQKFTNANIIAGRFIRKHKEPPKQVVDKMAKLKVNMKEHQSVLKHKFSEDIYLLDLQ